MNLTKVRREEALILEKDPEEKRRAYLYVLDESVGTKPIKIEFGFNGYGNGTGILGRADKNGKYQKKMGLTDWMPLANIYEQEIYGPGKILAVGFVNRGGEIEKIIENEIETVLTFDEYSALGHPHEIREQRTYEVNDISILERSPKYKTVLQRWLNRK